MSQLSKSVVLIAIILSLLAASAAAPAHAFRQTSAVVQSAGNPNAIVWVNTNSGVYHCRGTRWYGNTKSGQYMTQKQAQSKGYRPAYGSVCG